MTFNIFVKQVTNFPSSAPLFLLSFKHHQQMKDFIMSTIKYSIINSTGKTEFKNITNGFLN